MTQTKPQLPAPVDITKTHLRLLIDKLQGASQTQLKSLMDSSYDADAVKALSEDLIRAASKPRGEGAILPFDALIRKIISYVEDVRSGKLPLEDLKKMLDEPLEKVEVVVDLHEVRDDVQRASQYLERILGNHAITTRFWNRCAKSRGDLTELIGKLDAALTSSESGEVFKTDLKGLVLDLVKNSESIINSWILQLMLRIAGSDRVLYPYQCEMIDAPEDNQVWCKSVQVGLSWAGSLYGFMIAALEPGVLNLYVSKSMPQSIYVLSHARHELLEPLLERQPFKLGSRLYGFSVLSSLKTSVELWNHSQLFSVPSSPESFRGYTVRVAISDETAQHKDQAGVMGALLGRLSRGGQCIAISTPKGPLGWYAETVFAARKGNSVFKYHEAHWKQCPHLKPEVIEEKKRGMGPLLAEQEYEHSFLESLEAILPYPTISSCFDDYSFITPPQFKPEGPIIFGVDVGLGVDPSVVVILEKREHGFRLVGIHELKLKNTDELIAELNLLISLWKPSTAIIDSTSGGLGVYQALQQRHGDMIRSGENQTYDRRQALILNGQKFFSNKQIVLPNISETETLINQLSLFRRGRTPRGRLRFECAGHDDFAMSLFLGLSIAIEETDYVRPELDIFDWATGDQPRPVEEPEDNEENGDNEPEDEEPLTVECPGCGHSIPYRKGDEGRILLCAECGKSFRY